jgi:hypothetical protein
MKWERGPSLRATCKEPLPLAHPIPNPRKKRESAPIMTNDPIRSVKARRRSDSLSKPGGTKNVLSNRQRLTRRQGTQR